MKIFLVLAIINGFLSVALGAFGAHGLEGKVSEKGLEQWGKAVDYQMFHTMALFVTALLMSKIQTGAMTGAGWFFFIGIILFSGSLYIYAPTGIKTFAMITPLGGLSFLIGWILLGYAVIKHV
ncbi:DUF423 domain-containing protein [Halobacillus sp. ACCC02827]|uniref:DUF423 domain-containing protein n=1 Tax=Bacillaceae TaxID=186817 RepID=UPI0002A50A18|nr:MULTISPECIES: DUF423 domain-containing protein [Bacillaceae]ELK48992.1 hypothetical protein D479_00120 [Halobacillus sp. BAB-2008]QHT48214.1 DUF423 domain-containing protein [Bacillus sp. SB49]WJE15447.1 DUF423 domain-containing protein [Halobacillus sp. ACCC02827]